MKLFWRKKPGTERAAAPADRRQVKRYRAEWRVSFGSGERGWTVAVVTDASTVGLSFLSPEPCPLNVPLTLTISVPGLSAIHCVVEPLREIETETGILYGSRFLRFTGEGEEALKRALLDSVQKLWARENYVSPDQQQTRVVRIRRKG